MLFYSLCIFNLKELFCPAIEPGLTKYLYKNICHMTHSWCQLKMHYTLFSDSEPTLYSVFFSSSPQVNIIPIIAKADTISKSELHKFKIKIMSELVSNGVQIYQFPTDDETVSEINGSMNVSKPETREKNSHALFLIDWTHQHMFTDKTIVFLDLFPLSQSCYIEEDFVFKTCTLVYHMCYTSGNGSMCWRCVIGWNKDIC